MNWFCIQMISSSPFFIMYLNVPSASLRAYKTGRKWASLHLLVSFQLTLTFLLCFCVALVILICSPNMFLHIENMPALISGEIFMWIVQGGICIHTLCSWYAVMLFISNAFSIRSVQQLHLLSPCPLLYSLPLSGLLAHYSFLNVAF